MNESKLAVIHISDCHFGHGHFDHEARVRAIASAIRPQVREAEAILFAITGDVAWTGAEAEYSNAADALAELVHIVAIEFPEKDRFVAIVPGNHDCDFSRAGVIRDALLGGRLALEEEKWDQDVTRQLMSVQENYECFSKAVDNVLSPVSHQGVITRATIRCGENSVGIWGINTAWTSSKNEKPGSLWVPVQAFRGLLSLDNSGIEIALVHHPAAWIHEAHRRTWMETLNSNVHVVLQGHEHTPGVWERSNFEDQRALFVEGGVFSDRSSEANSAFNVLLINLTNPSTQLTTYALDTDRYLSSVGITRGLTVAPTSIARGRVLSQMHTDYLDGPGASFSHPRKANVCLDDIYVYPDAVDLDDKGSDGALERVTSSANILSSLVPKAFVIVVGQERSGKTTFSKQAARSLYRDGLTPVLLRGELLKSRDAQDIEASVERAYVEQYKHKDVDFWRQLPKEQRALVIDNIDAIAVNTELTGRLLGELPNRYGVVVCTADSSLFFGASLSQESIQKYERFELQDLGHVKRDELISRWVRLGQEHSIDQGELQLARDSRAGIINALMGKNLIPARPVFILVLLQSIEAGSQDTLKGASYGNYYEFLITNALLRSGIKPDELDSIQNYLSELANALIETDGASMSIEKKAKFDAEYLEKYDVRMYLGKVGESLKKADILVEWDERVRFKYRYALYYFAARYLARKIGIDPDADKRIEWLVRHLYLSKSSDLLLFVTHHCSHPLVLDMLLDRARRLFVDVAPLSLESESEWINQLVNGIPRLVMQDKSTEEYRRERLESKDRMESSADDGSDESTRADDTELDLAAEMNISFRVTATLGQVLRNHYGSLTAEKKLEIARVAYALVGRVLARYVRDISDHKAELISWLQDHLEKKGFASKEKARDKAASIMFSWMSWLIFAVIRRSGELLGSQKLQITHERLSGESESALSRLISLATDLDHPSLTSGGRVVAVPISKICNINRHLKGNPCAQVVLRRMALDHAYKYSIDIRDKQKLCSELGIPVARQEQIALLSTRRKS